MRAAVCCNNASLGDAHTHASLQSCSLLALELPCDSSAVVGFWRLGHLGHWHNLYFHAHSTWLFLRHLVTSTFERFCNVCFRYRRMLATTKCFRCFIHNAIRENYESYIFATNTRTAFVHVCVTASCSSGCESY